MEVRKRFSDFAKEHQPLDGAKLKIEDILNKEILLLDFRVKPSKYEKNGCLTLQFMIGEETHVVFTGSTVLTDQIMGYKSELPFYTTIKKIDRYYTFT
jgi:hypothetical protein